MKHLMVLFLVSLFLLGCKEEKPDVEEKSESMRSLVKDKNKEKLKAIYNQKRKSQESERNVHQINISGAGQNFELGKETKILILKQAEAFCDEKIKEKRKILGKQLLTTLKKSKIEANSVAISSKDKKFQFSLEIKIAQSEIVMSSCSSLTN